MTGQIFEELEHRGQIRASVEEGEEPTTTPLMNEKNDVVTGT